MSIGGSGKSTSQKCTDSTEENNMISDIWQQIQPAVIAALAAA